jgi:hypothetical protein
MIDYDDLRKRVEEWGGKEHHPGWLIYDLWCAVQELLNGPRNAPRPQLSVDSSEDISKDIVDGYDTPGWPQFEPVTAEELDATPGLDGQIAREIFAHHGPLYRQRKS